MFQETEPNSPFYLEKQQQQKHPVPRSDDLLREASTICITFSELNQLTEVEWRYGAYWMRLSSCPATKVFCFPLRVNPAAQLPVKKCFRNVCCCSCCLVVILGGVVRGYQKSRREQIIPRIYSEPPQTTES